MKKLLATLMTMTAMSMSAQMLPYQNAQLTAEQRADDLLGRLTLDEKVKLMMDTSPAIPRLGIPQFQWWNEALHGVGRNGYATVYPITMAMAASWDDALVHKVFTAVSDEARVKAQQAKRSGNIQRYQSIRVCHFGHPTSTFSVILVGVADKRLMAKTRILPPKWDWLWCAVCKVLAIRAKTWA